MTEKPSNPKDLLGSEKLPLGLVPGSAMAAMSVGLMAGMLKYGKVNWRAVGIRYSVYIDALYRHLDALKEGEDLDPDTGVPHLAFVLAGAAILQDALEAGQVEDDRAMPAPGYRNMMSYWTSLATKIKKLYADKSPKHYLTADAAAQAKPAVVVPPSILPLKKQCLCLRCQTPIGCAERKFCDKFGNSLADLNL